MGESWSSGETYLQSMVMRLGVRLTSCGGGGAQPSGEVSLPSMVMGLWVRLMGRGVSGCRLL